jgi:hypothetical protein
LALNFDYIDRIDDIFQKKMHVPSSVECRRFVEFELLKLFCNHFDVFGKPISKNGISAILKWQAYDLVITNNIFLKISPWAYYRVENP